MGLQESLRTEKVEKLALREAIMVSPTVTVREAVERMVAARLGCVMVADAEERPLGTFTEEDLIQLLVNGSKGLDDRVDAHLSEKWASVRLSDPIAKVLLAMRLKNLRFVCVTNEESRVVALTGQKGLMEYVADHFPRQVMVQRVGLKLSTEQREGG